MALWNDITLNQVANVGQMDANSPQHHIDEASVDDYKCIETGQTLFNNARPSITKVPVVQTQWREN